MTDKPHHLGHRERLRERFLDGGGASMPDYEVLELLLFQARPRADMKPLAKALIAEFGSFAEVISAPVERLEAVDGVGPSVIATLKVVRESALRLLQAQIMEKPVIGSWEALIDYCRASMAYGQTEQFRILFLDKRNRIIADEAQQEGTVDHTPVYPREVAKRALELGASALILVHNHPSGDPTPSRADIDMTGKIVKAGEALGIAVHDHLVIGRADHASFREQGLL